MWVYFLGYSEGEILKLDDTGLNFPATITNDTDVDYLAWASTRTVVPYNYSGILNSDYGALAGTYSHWSNIHEQAEELREEINGLMKEAITNLTHAQLLDDLSVTTSLDIARYIRALAKLNALSDIELVNSEIPELTIRPDGVNIPAGHTVSIYESPVDTDYLQFHLQLEKGTVINHVDLSVGRINQGTWVHSTSNILGNPISFLVVDCNGSLSITNNEDEEITVRLRFITY